MEHWAIIPARAGSKGVKDKNITNLGGYPLLAWTIAAAKLCPSITRVIVSTDSDHYAAIAEQYGAEAPFLRPASVSGDTATDYDWVRHLIHWYQQEEIITPDYLVHLRPTTPFRDPAVIESAITKFAIRQKGTSLRSAHKLDEHPFKMFVKDGDLYRPFAQSCGASVDANAPRQGFEDVYVPNGYVDILNTWHIIDSDNIHGGDILAFETEPVIEIDTPCHLECARAEVFRKEIKSTIYQYLEQLF